MLGRQRKPKSGKNKAKHTETVPPIQQQQGGGSDMDALMFLDGLVAKAPVNRATHVAAQNAMQQLTRALQRLDAFMIAKSADKQDKEKPDEQRDKGKGED